VNFSGELLMSLRDFARILSSLETGSGTVSSSNQNQQGFSQNF
jgi:hypothetical protein